MSSIPSARLPPPQFLRALFDVAVRRALPSANLAAHLPPPPRGRTLVLGAGKASAAMAQALEALWPVQAPMSGLVVTRYHHTPPRDPQVLQRIEIIEARHPVPDAAGRVAAERILALTQGLSDDDLVLCLISGGGSALLSLPAPGVSFEQKQAINQALLRSGAHIGEMNCVRKHLSAIKGGRLGVACAPAPMVSLLISDVPGDDPAVIASGPTVADPTTCSDALQILDRYAIPISAAVRHDLRSGALETPKPGDLRLAHHQVRIIATPWQSLQAAAEWAVAQGIAAHILGDDIEGESRVVGQVHAALARAIVRHNAPFTAPCVLLSGGETTVTVTAPVTAAVTAPGSARARGGRAGEFALGAAINLNGEPGVYVLAADTDGIDGSEQNAGALVHPDTLQRARALGLNPQAFLDRNDSFGLFEPLGDLVTTGPTYTNVNDFRAVLIMPA